MCHEIFDLYFSMIRPIWAPDKQGKVFSNSVSISPRYSNIKKLRGVHHTAESWKKVYKKTLQSQALMCDITMKIIKKVTNCLRNLFNFRRFSIKRSEKKSWIWKQENWHFRSSLTLQCDAHRGVKTQISQKTRWCASHRGVKLHTVESDSKSLRVSGCF